VAIVSCALTFGVSKMASFLGLMRDEPAVRPSERMVVNQKNIKFLKACGTLSTNTFQITFQYSF
jgi:hypothetical protein